MTRCEDYPCCGHESGCCPDYNKDGKQLNMKCTCGATLPRKSRYSVCYSCLDRSLASEGDGDDCWYDDSF